MWRAEFPSTTQWNGPDKGKDVRTQLVLPLSGCFLNREAMTNEDLISSTIHPLVIPCFTKFFTLFSFSHSADDVYLVPFADPLGWFFHSVLWNLRIYGQLGIELV